MRRYDEYGAKEKPNFEIRSLLQQDVDQITEMAANHFPENRQNTQYFKNKLIANLDNSHRSLVCNTREGSIEGFLSVKLVDFMFRGRPVTGAIFSDFMVNEKARTALIPMRMLQKSLHGPQDFSYSDDAVHASCLLWCKLGGEIAYPYSNYYTFPLRPITFSVQMAGKNRFTPKIKRASSRITLGVDKVLEKLGFPYFRNNGITGIEFRSLTSDRLYKGLSPMMSKFELYPAITPQSIENFLSALANDKQFGTLEAVSVLDDYGQQTGWFIYYVDSLGRCNVVHAESLPGKENHLFSALKSDVHQKGGVNFSGRLSPSQMGTSFSEKTFGRPGGKWALVHSKNRELLQAVQSGRAFLTRCW